MTDMTPREIVHALDQHIVGQAEAKRAVAIALRNRWRRLQLAPGLREEVTPKNIRLRKLWLTLNERERYGKRKKSA